MIPRKTRAKDRKSVLSLSRAYGEVLGPIFGNVYVIILGIDVGT